MNQATEASPNPRAVSRAKLLGLMGLYAAPLLLAWAWYAYVTANEGAGLSVNGELIHPAVPLAAFELNTLASDEGQSASQTQWGLDEIRGKWSMVYFAGDTCDEACEATLFDMRQIRLSTGRRMERVRRVLVTPAWIDMQNKLADANEGLQVVGGDIEPLRTQFNDAQSEMQTCEECIYLVDPNGNLMMRFSTDLPPAKILHDLKHLLKTSRIG